MADLLQRVRRGIGGCDAQSISLMSVAAVVAIVAEVKSIGFLFDELDMLQLLGIETWKRTSVGL